MYSKFTLATVTAIVCLTSATGNAAGPSQAPDDAAASDRQEPKAQPPAQDPAPAQPQPKTAPKPSGEPSTDPEKRPLSELPPAPEGEGIEAGPLIAADAKPISLDDAMALALRRHPRLIRAQREIDAAKARVGQAQADYFPRIDGWLQYVRASEQGSVTSIYSVPGNSRVGGTTRDGVGVGDSFNNYFAAVILRQVVYDFGRTRGNIDGRKALVMAAAANFNLVEQQVSYGVMEAFYAVRAARANVTLAQETYATTLQILELARAARKAGLKPPSETARAEANVASAEVLLIRAKAQLQITRAQVGAALGTVTEPYEPTEHSPAPETVPSESDAIDTALKNRPELRVLGYQHRGVAQQLRGAKAEQYPRIDFTAGINSRGQFVSEAEQDQFQVFNWNAGFVVQVPIFQGLRVRKRKQELRAQMKAIDTGQLQVRQAVIVEAKQALAAVHAADAAAKASERGVIAAKSALDTLAGRYRQGLARLVELTDAQQTYVAARSQLVEATYDRFLSRAVLRLVMGNVTP